MILALVLVAAVVVACFLLRGPRCPDCGGHSMILKHGAGERLFRPWETWLCLDCGAERDRDMGTWC